MNDWTILHWTPLWHFWQPEPERPMLMSLLLFFLFFLPWISLNCIVRWIHVSQPGPTVPSCLSKSVCLKKKKKWWTKCGQCVDLEYKKRCILCKTACTLFIVCDGACPVRPPVGLRGCCIVCCSIADVNSVWGLDLRQTGRQSLSSQQPTSLSATLAVTKSIMFSLLCHFQHHRGFVDFSLLSFLPWFFFSFHLLQLLVSWMVSSVRATCQAKREGLPIRKTLGKTQLHSGRERDCGISRRGKVRDGNCDVTSCVYQETVYTTVLFVPMAFLLRMLMAYSPRLVPFSSFRSGFLRTNILIKWGQIPGQKRCDVSYTPCH